jgi:hypothetical protein
VLMRNRQRGRWCSIMRASTLFAWKDSCQRHPILASGLGFFTTPRVRVLVGSAWPGRAMMDALGHRPPPPAAALTIATMPALTASGSRSQASMTAARSGSDRGVFWGVNRGRFSSAPSGRVRHGGVGRSWKDGAEVTGEGLEPSTNGLTYLIGFHRPPRPRFGAFPGVHDESRLTG